MGRSAAVLLMIAIVSQQARAQNAVRPLRLELVPNFNTCSVYAFFDGDDNGNAKAKLEYRAGEAKAFRTGHPLSRTGTGRLAGSIFALTPDEPLEVRVSFDDPDIPQPTAPDKAALSAKTRTGKAASEGWFVRGGKQKAYYVGPAGDDGNAGTRQKPFKTIARAVGAVQPGQTVVLLGGVYFESVVIRKSGRPEAYITISRDRLGDGPPGDELPYVTGGEVFTGPWTPLAGGIHVADEKRPVNTVLDMQGRLYHHPSLKALRSAQPPLQAGWWQDAEAGKLYVRGRGAGGRRKVGVLRLGILPFGMRFENCGYWIVDGVGFRHFGGGSHPRGIEIRNSHHIVVRNCRFRWMRTGILIRKQGSRHCLVAKCTFVDDGIWTWPWKACKSHDVEGAAISLAGGGGNVVRHNRISGFFNGIVASTWGDLENEGLNRDLDIHDNFLTQIGDDPLEPEGACMNVRFWNNTTRDTLQGISLAPITVGPVYVIRDRYVNFKGGAVKVSLSSRGPVFLYHVLGWTARPGKNALQVSGPWDNMHFRNCIFRGTRYVIEDFHEHRIGCSFDHCALFSTDRQFVKWANKRYWNLSELAGAPGFGKHILRVEPYAGTPDATEPFGRLNRQLIDAGAPIPGVNDDFKGAAPDIGPEETDAKPRR